MSFSLLGIAAMICRCTVSARQEILTSIIPFVLSQFHSHSPLSNSDLDYVNLTTHAEVSSGGLSCCCHLRFCVVACRPLVIVARTWKNCSSTIAPWQLFFGTMTPDNPHICMFSHSPLLTTDHQPHRHSASILFQSLGAIPIP